MCPAGPREVNFRQVLSCRRPAVARDEVHYIYTENGCGVSNVFLPRNLVLKAHIVYLKICCFTRCCAVARTQHVGQNGRFAQQGPPRGWLRATQNAFFGAQHFLPRAKKMLRRREVGCAQRKTRFLARNIFRRGRKKCCASFLRLRRLFFWPPFSKLP